MPIDKDAYYAATYLANNGSESDWDISTAVGWNPDYLDPRSYLNIYSPVNGDQLTSIGLDGTSDPDNFQDSDKAVMEAVGLFDYQKLLEEADAITDDLDARYTAYAKADAWIIENAFAISVQCTAVANTVTRSVLSWDHTQLPDKW